jgi:hypothetical protein
MDFEKKVSEFLQSNKNWIIDQIEQDGPGMTAELLGEYLVAEMAPSVTAEELLKQIAGILSVYEKVHGGDAVSEYLKRRSEGPKSRFNKQPDSLSEFMKEMEYWACKAKDAIAKKVILGHLESMTFQKEIVECHRWGSIVDTPTASYSLPDQYRVIRLATDENEYHFQLKFTSNLLVESLAHFTSKFMGDDCRLVHARPHAPSVTGKREVDTASFFFDSVENAQAGLAELKKNFQFEMIQSDLHKPSSNADRPHCVYLLWDDKSFEQEYLTDEEYAAFDGSDTPGGNYRNLVYYWTENEWSDARYAIAGFDT